MPGDTIELTVKTTAGGATDDTVTLAWALRQKSRQRLRLDGGREAALVLTPGTFLDDGDRLESGDGYSVRVCAAREPVSVARTHDALRLARACYHLGNRHVALQVGDGWVRYLPDHVLDDMVRGLGLVVNAALERFEPERGAYAHGHASGHGHTHGPDDAAGHAHGSASDHAGDAHDHPHESDHAHGPHGQAHDGAHAHAPHDHHAPGDAPRAHPAPQGARS